jgi:ApaG protein
MSSSTATTQGIRVTVDAHFSPEHSAPHRQNWYFLYAVRIENLGDLAVQLQSRHWVITDGRGSVEEVRGPGVVGQQPVLLPGTSFEYTSGCPLKTPRGSMVGSYEMTTPTGDTFSVEVGQFDLRAPEAVQ